MTTRRCIWPLVAILIVACDSAGDAPPADAPADAPADEPAAAREASEPRTVPGIPDPCALLSASEAQEILGLEAELGQTPMGDADGGSRTCVYTDAAQTAWINIGYEGLNPQVVSAQGRSEEELVEVATSFWAYGLEHLETTETDGHPTLVFGNADRTLMVVFTDIGSARELPEGFPERFSIASYYNPTLLIHAPDRSQDERLAALESLVDRPVAQLTEAAGG